MSKTFLNPRRIAFKPWQSAVIGLLLLMLFGFLAVYLLRNESTKPIDIERGQLSTAQLESLQAVTTPLGGVQFFGADLTGIYQAVSQLTWVGDARVYRDWHRGVVVSVTPRQPIANYGSSHLLDASGVVYTPADMNELMNTKLINLHGREDDAVAIMRKLRQVNTWFEPLGIHAQDLILTPRRTWIVRFNNGMRVIVDHENTEQKLYSLSMQLQNNLAKEVKRIGSVDLRYKNGFAVAWR